MKNLFKKPMDSIIPKSDSNSASISISKDTLPDINSNIGSDLSKDLNATGNKNLWTGTKSSLTYTKNANHHYVPNFHKEFNPNQDQKIKGIFEDFDYFLEEVEGNVTYRRNRITTSGTNSSAVPHGIMQKATDEKAPYKPKDGKVETWLDRMPQRKLNQGLTYLQKQHTHERDMELKAAGEL